MGSNNLDDKQFTEKELIGCARCGDRHESLEVIPFDNPPDWDADSDIPTHWAECPNTGDPILFYVREAE